MRIPWTVPSIPWDYGTGQDSGIWGYTSGWDVCEFYRQPVQPMGLWDGMGHWVLGFRMGGCMGIPGTVLPILQ